MPNLAISSLDERLEDLRMLVERILCDPPATKLALKRVLAEALAIEPKPEILQAFSALEELTDKTGRELAVRTFVVHLAIETSLAEAWDSRALDLNLLRRCMDWMPSLIALHEDEQSGFAVAIGRVDRIERDAFRKLRNGLVAAEEPLFAARVVVPEIARLAVAVHEGRLAEVAASLDADEIEVIALAATHATDAARPDRGVVDAIALRTLIERDLEQWRALPPEEEDDEDAAGLRRDLRSRLEAASVAHGVVSPRLDALRSRCFLEARRPSRRLDQVRRRLFAAFLDLRKALAGVEIEPAHEILEMISEAELAGAAVDAQKETTETLMRDAATPGDETRSPMELSPDSQDVVRGHRRRKVLVGIAAALVPVAVGMNLALGTWVGAPKGLTTKDFEKVLPLQEVVPLPGAVYSQVSSVLWGSLDEGERKFKVNGLAQIARREGFSMLLLVDENRRELARSSVAGGTEIFADADPVPEPPAVEQPSPSPEQP